MKKNLLLFLYIALAIILLLPGCGNVGDGVPIGGKYQAKAPYSEEVVLEPEEEKPSEKYKDYGENPFIKVAEKPTSTFSVDADGGSYANMRRFLTLGQNPPKESVRIEEFLNYFTFDYADPSGDENVALNSELSTCPWNAEHHLLRLGIKGKSIPAEELPDSNYVLLIDVSGSMNSPEKLGMLKEGFKTLVDNLKATDRIAIVTYSGSVEILLDSTYGDKKVDIKVAINKLNAEGSTAGGAAIVKAYEIAEKNLIAGGNNRIILGSDGDFNVGISDTDELVKLIEEKRDKGVYLTVLGVGSGNLNDHMMEQLANHGNGNYEYIDCAKQMDKVFTKEFSKFYTVAKDSKIQVNFNKNMVESYRLIGYENRKLNDEDFEDDLKDAGEIGAGQTITAIYELVLCKSENPKTLTNENYATFDFRYKKPNADKSQALPTHEVTTAPKDINSASENMRFAAAVTGFGLLMKESEYKASLNKAMVISLAENSISFDKNGYKKEFVKLVKDWKGDK